MVKFIAGVILGFGLGVVSVGGAHATPEMGSPEWHEWKAKQAASVKAHVSKPVVKAPVAATVKPVVKPTVSKPVVKPVTAPVVKRPINQEWQGRSTAAFIERMNNEQRQETGHPSYVKPVRVVSPSGRSVSVGVPSSVKPAPKKPAACPAGQHHCDKDV